MLCVCTDSSFQINLPVWHTLCLTGEACHPASPVHILILVRRADLSFTPSTAKPPRPPSLSLSPPSLFHTLSFCHFSPLQSFSLSLYLPHPLFLSFRSLSFSPPPSLSIRHTKLSWSHYFEEKWSVDVEEGGMGGSERGGLFSFSPLSHTDFSFLPGSFLLLFFLLFFCCRSINDTAVHADM